MRDSDLELIFGQCGKVVRCHLNKLRGPRDDNNRTSSLSQSRGSSAHLADAFVEFERAADASQAMVKLRTLELESQPCVPSPLPDPPSNGASLHSFPRNSFLLLILCRHDPILLRILCAGYGERGSVAECVDMGRILLEWAKSSPMNGGSTTQVRPLGLWAPRTRASPPVACRGATTAGCWAIGRANALCLAERSVIWISAACLTRAYDLGQDGWQAPLGGRLPRMRRTGSPRAQLSATPGGAGRRLDRSSGIRQHLPALARRQRTPMGAPVWLRSRSRQRAWASWGA